MSNYPFGCASHGPKRHCQGPHQHVGVEGGVGQPDVAIHVVADVEDHVRGAGNDACMLCTVQITQWELSKIKVLP